MIDIVLITTGKRPEMLQQTIDSMIDNSAQRHSLTMVWDGERKGQAPGGTTVIINQDPQGASASRNIGASSIPKYRRHEYVMFIDDDVYMLPEWDTLLLQSALHGTVLSGHAHPFNHSLGEFCTEQIRLQTAGVLSTVHLIMPWDIWDDVGFFVEPGGPGGSEDVEWCARATKKGYGLAVTDPMCVLHCGLTSSHGKQIVGYDLMMEMNDKLVKFYQLEGKVVYE